MLDVLQCAPFPELERKPLALDPQNRYRRSTLCRELFAIRNSLQPPRLAILHNSSALELHRRLESIVIATASQPAVAI